MKSIKYDYFNNNAKKLFISFAPNAADGKYLFYAIREQAIADCLFFLDTSDRYYAGFLEEITACIEQICAAREYTDIIITGFSAGALTACLIGTRLNYKRNIYIHAFSPYISLNTKYSNAYNKLGNTNDACYDLRQLNLEGDQCKINLYFPTKSVSDGYHVRDSFALRDPNIRSYYLRTNHNTSIIVRENYPQQLMSLINGTFSVPRELLATPDDIVQCLMLTDIVVAENEARISPYIRMAEKPQQYPAEYTHWQARQLARAGNLDAALQWGWAAIIKSAPNVPDSYPETLGHMAYDNGRPVEALRAYLLMQNPSKPILDRIALLRKWNG